MPPKGAGEGANRQFKLLWFYSNKYGIKLTFNLASIKHKYARLTYRHQQLMVSKTSNSTIARYITSSTKAITK
jgi:hypothetical protein